MAAVFDDPANLWRYF